MKQTKKFKKGDLVYLKDSVPRMGMYEELGMWNRMRLHGKTGIVIAWAGDSELTESFDAYQTCWKVLVDNKVEIVQEVYMKNVEDIILG